MPRTKSSKIAELEKLPHYLKECEKYAGKWAAAYFGNDHPLVIELGCGKGEYANWLARLFPHKNFIGIDIKGARLWRAAGDSATLGLTNVVFIRARAEQIDRLFGPAEIDEIWLPFPDPFPKRRHVSKRMTTPDFLRRYRRILRPGGKLHLKTDDAGMFDFTREMLLREGWKINVFVPDLHGSGVVDEVIGFRTDYERRHLAEGKTIGYLSALPPEK